MNWLNYIFWAIFLFSRFSTFHYCKSPNFIFILTDDQDITLGGMVPMRKTFHLLADYGAEFTNMFVTTPLCCPSRASILTGKYAHSHGVRNNSLSGNCNSRLWQLKHEGNAFITHFKQHGYSTLYAGKYLNQYGAPAAGGVEHVPTGWDHWIGLVGNSVYYNYSLSVNGKRIEHGSNPNKDYLTNVVFEEAMKFLSKQNGTVPFFVFLSPPAPHGPFTPFPPYKNKFYNRKAPRTPNFAVPGGKQKHWLLRQPPNPLPTTVIDSIDDVFRNRWRTLLSVDENIQKMITMLKNQNILENTYIVFTSDNGFHLGQFSLPWDKRQLYEFDIRVPLLIRGPGIKPGIKIKHPVLNIDLAPTFLELANLPTRGEFDGLSFASLLKSQTTMISNRSSFFIEHQGEFTNKPIAGCPQYQPREVHTCEIDCICEDSWNNTYVCYRLLSENENFKICLFKDEELGEAYNISADPYELKNIFHISKKMNVLHELKSVMDM